MRSSSNIGSTGSNEASSLAAGRGEQRQAPEITDSARLLCREGCNSEKKLPPRPACEPLHALEHGKPAMLRSPNVTYLPHTQGDLAPLTMIAIRNPSSNELPRQIPATIAHAPSTTAPRRPVTSISSSSI
ncbi:hypothetical protein ON010_g9464 [Phytophthora cinnamomi]|nr:hypothetical protein ON010_g9464 [Phytophthora cinnamomi]